MFKISRIFGMGKNGHNAESGFTELQSVVNRFADLFPTLHKVTFWDNKALYTFIRNQYAMLTERHKNKKWRFESESHKAIALMLKIGQVVSNEGVDSLTVADIHAIAEFAVNFYSIESDYSEISDLLNQLDSIGINHDTIPTFNVKRLTKTES